MALPKIILVPTDLSPCAELALDYAVELAAKLDARIQLLNVVDLHGFGIDYGVVLVEDVIASLREGNQRSLEKLVAARSTRVAFATPRVELGDPRMTIVDTAAMLPADLVVMGTHGRRGVTRLLLGSVAEAVSRSAPCPVLLVREKPANKA